MRSNRTPAVYFDEILAAASRLERYCADLTFDSFEGNVEKQDAILYRLLVLTEAAHRLTAEEQALCPSQEWRKIRGLGNVLKHEYDSISLENIWRIIHEELPSLKTAVERTMHDHFPDVPRS